MPQMMPLVWIMMLMFLLIILLLFMSFLYFFFFPSLSSMDPSNITPNNFKNKKIFWPWTW